MWQFMPFRPLAEAAVAAMLRAVEGDGAGAPTQVLLPFDVCTPENVLTGRRLAYSGTESPCRSSAARWRAASVSTSKSSIRLVEQAGTS